MFNGFIEKESFEKLSPSMHLSLLFFGHALFPLFYKSRIINT